MNDTEHTPHSPEDLPNGTPSSSGSLPARSVSMGDIKARQSVIAAAIREDDASSRATVAAAVRLFQPDIAQARVDGRSWDHIAAMLTAHGIVATPDAVRMAHKRFVSRKRTTITDRGTNVSFRPLATGQPPPGSRPTPDPPSAGSASQKPNIAPRVR